MKKENKELAKQRRAKERAKQARQALLMKIGIGLAIALVAVALVIVTVKTSGSDTDASDTDEVTTEAETDTTTETDADVEDVDSEEDASSASDQTLNTDTSHVVAEGDTVNIDYVAYNEDGTTNDEVGSTNGAGTDLTIGSGSFIDGFEDGLIGANVGDTVDLHLTFPDDYWHESLQGVTVIFSTTINGVYE